MLLAGAAASVAGSTAALQLIGNTAISPGGAPKTNADVRRELARATPTQSPGSSEPGQPGQTGQPRHQSGSPKPPGTSKSQPPPGSNQAPVTGTSQTQGGSVFASCSAGQVRLTSWIPANGYRTDDSAAGPAASAHVTFTSTSGEVSVTATCGTDGHPRFTTSADDHHGGGGGDDHGGGGGGGGRGGGGGGHGADG